MKYYLIRVAYNKVDDVEELIKPAAFNTYDEANKSFHAAMYQNINDGVHSKFLCMVVNEFGNVEKMERWEEPVQETETTTNPETPVTPEEPSEGGEE